MALTYNGSAPDIGAFEYDDAYVPTSEDTSNTFQIQNIFPNPVNTTTRITYSIQDPGTYKLKIYNICGQLVKHLFERELQAGNHEITWDAKNTNGSTVSNGGYIIRLSTNKSFVTGKIVVLK